MTKRKGTTKPETATCPNCGTEIEMVYEMPLRGYAARCPCSGGVAVLFRRDHRPATAKEAARAAAEAARVAGLTEAERYSEKWDGCTPDGQMKPLGYGMPEGDGGETGPPSESSLKTGEGTEADETG